MVIILSKIKASHPITLRTKKELLLRWTKVIQDLHPAMITFVVALRATAGNLISIQKHGSTSKDKINIIYNINNNIIKNIFNAHFSNACSCEMAKSEGEYDSSRNDSVIGDTANLTVSDNGKLRGSSSDVITGSINLRQETIFKSCDVDPFDESHDTLPLPDSHQQKSGIC